VGFIRYRSGHRSVSKDMAEKAIAGFTWLILSFARKHPFPEGVLYPEAEHVFLNTSPPANKDTQSKWILEHFCLIKTWCNMENWQISFVPEPDETESNNAKQKIKLSHSYDNDCDEKYYVDNFGRPVFYYDGSQAMDIGYINFRMTQKLVEQLHKTARKPLNIRVISNQDLYIMCGVFLGFGHIYCAKDQSKQYEHEHLRENIAAFSLAIYFILQGIGKSKALKTYGHLMSKTTKRDLKNAFIQLAEYKEQMQELIDIYESIDKQRLVA